MKPGRNDPCPCGSGKKYKHCCLMAPEATVADLEERHWRQIRAAIDGYGTQLLRFTGEFYGEDAVQQAWAEFTIGKSEEFVQGEPNTELFFSWLFYRWIPTRSKGNTLRDATLFGIAPAGAYVAKRGGRLDPRLKQYLEACLDTPFGFHEIEDVRPGVGFATCDVFTGSRLRVRERSASATLKDGDIVYGLIVPLERFALVEGLGPYSFPPVYKTHLIHVRPRSEIRRHGELALRSLYFSLSDAYLHPPQPKLCNTDGDPLEPRTLTFDLESPLRAFEALASLALDTSREQLLADARLDADGTVLEAEIPWIRRNDSPHAALETVLLGRLRIDGWVLTVEVNSAKRAKTFRSLVEATPAAGARYRKTRKSRLAPDAALRSAGPGVQFAPRDTEQAELMQRPEVRAHLDRLQRRHYETWPDIPLPALQNKTPLQAMQTPDGREMVEALVRQFERDAAAMPVPPDPEIFASLRCRLGL